MLRNCLIAIGVWLALLAGYGYWLMPQLRDAERFVVPLVLASVVGFGLLNFSGAFFTLRDWRARNRLARGERPRGGELVSAIGPLRATHGALIAPFSGEECVYYTYDFGPGSGSEPARKDYVGIALARCAVQSPFGEFHVGTSPVLEGFEEKRGDRTLAEEYIGKTTFEAIGFMELAKKTFGAHRQRPPFRYDWKLGEPNAQIDSAEIQQTAIPVGEVVTVIGIYDAATNAIVSDTEQLGFLRMIKGGEARRIETIPWRAIGQFIFGIAVIAIANGVLWYGLENLRR